jgi:hypothetical protein
MSKKTRNIEIDISDLSASEDVLTYLATLIKRSVRFTHYRPYIVLDPHNGYARTVCMMPFSRRSKFGVKPLNFGGVTVASVTIGWEKWEGVAECSLDDNFCYSTGRALAMQHILCQLHSRLYPANAPLLRHDPTYFGK